MMQVTAVARRSSGWWAVEVPELPGLLTQTKRLDQVEAMVQDAALSLTGESVDVRLRVVLEDGLQDRIDRAREGVRAATEAQRVAARRMREVVGLLREQGLTVRDAGVVLGVTPQRVSQLGKGDGH